MKITPLAIPDVLLITPKRHGDARGWFSETWSQKALAGTVADTVFVQDNQAYSSIKGILRGLHFQKSPNAQGKLIRSLRGTIFDVVVDIRAGSPTYGQSVNAVLTAEGGEQLWVPRGFAHGYCTMTAECEIFYKVDAPYAPGDEGGIMWNDPDLAIPWPLEGEPMLSDKDTKLPRLKDLGPVAF
ncbi:MAG: dTDP-4-dehydrorhamnose 3,5-epimerase [Alphaproteobacteria bacterium]|nr:dTDP-4-dehydrorhamnose 3,5-epimerase [Alphaproteobacteria bacterium]MBU1517075.1 dTDP-4-dehydrorhamnose 3,5-epimerase [Alphaproteobacteria bacterium]MBU2093694.1 dTDP-4-dehydrorhamnose 3,5-epimerase [Alphaproteobacteria bacterium]MBU2153984.1 dTDP-4-dehydrorhamnose 3,5-epimerase [Alphaproteobacteria bacterium]MBU2308706.1 dTDP-4-dehydrorhamnose 3,5-epimerase [Alphaproteobacteria bacterium]